MKISLKDSEKHQRNDDIADFLKTTGNSLAFKTIGREKKAHWSNRFVKDFYDLDYNNIQNKHKNNTVFKTNKQWNLKRTKINTPQSALKRFSKSI